MREQSQQKIAYIVTYPRTGHHALISFLDKITNVADKYCEFYSCTRHDGPKIPCRMDGVGWKNKNYQCGSGKTIVKNHDFALTLPITPECKYIVLYRHPFYSIESWYEMEKEKKKEMPFWEDFFFEKLEFWQGFVNKWVVENRDQSNLFLCQYDDLRNNETLYSMLRFMGFDVGFPSFDINLAFRSSRILEKNELYIKTEPKISEQLKDVGLKPLFE